ncbi:MAG TPA: type II secretion system protein [Candidatus Acidoferrum sp.]|nr:type II secretion system protein [Candidatus Acidoferrum sp.]
MMSRKQAGFTLMETMVALVILLGVSAVVMSGMVQMMWTQGTITNRTEMHTSVRSATELLQQEIGQAGKMSLPTPPAGVAWAMTSAVAIPGATGVTTLPAATFNVVDALGNPVLYEGEWVTVDTGLNKESVQLTCLAGPGNCPAPSNTWEATFYNAHTPAPILGSGTNGVPITIPGAFSAGIIPPAAGVMPAPPPGYAGYPDFPAGYPVAPALNQGSTGTVLKLFGDVNGDGNLVYVEYTCAPGTPANPGFLYRNQVNFWDSLVVPPLDPSMIVLTGVLANPNDANGNPVPCFNYQLLTKDGLFAAAHDLAFVTDVAVTLTVQTSNPDPQTHLLQTETKALLNVSPRNVYDAWDFATMDYTNRVQPTPPLIKSNILINYQ